MLDKQKGLKELIAQTHPWLLLSMAMLASLFLGEQGASQLQYQRAAIFDGQLYRLFTAHIVHTNIYHGLMNLVGLVLIGFLSRYHMVAKDWWLGMLICALTVSSGLILFDPHVEWYRGMSGVLHGIAILLIMKARQLAGFVRIILLLGLTIKVLLEQLQMGLWHSDLLVGAPVIVNAHLYGVIGGFCSFFVVHLSRSKRMFRENF